MSRYSKLTKTAGVKPDSVIIDCACGDGRGLSHLLTLEPKVLVAVDNDVDKMYRAMRICETQPPKNYERILFSCADIRRLHFESYFDYFYCCETLEHVHPKDNERTARSIAKSIKPGGRLLISIPGHEDSIKNPRHLQLIPNAMLFNMFVGSGKFLYIKRDLYWKYPNDHSIKRYYPTKLFVFEKRKDEYSSDDGIY